MLLPVCPTSPCSLANMTQGWFICFVFTWDSRHITATATNRAMTKGTVTTTSTTHLPQHLIGVFFFWPFTCFYIFTKQLYSFRLHYYTRPPLLMQTWHRVDLSVLFALRIATTLQPLPPTKWWWSRHHNLNPNSYLLQHLMSLVCFFLPFTSFFYTEQLYSFRLCYYTWPSLLACKCNTGLVDQIIQTCHLFLDFHRSVLLCIE